MLPNELSIEIRDFYKDNAPIPEKLAAEVLKVYFKGNTPNFPIDVFKLIRDFWVFYKFSDLKRLEGAYLPEQETLPPVVSININRGYQRQRFTCAHELAHHLKDFRREILCPLNAQNPIEIYANNFANELLMPTEYFLNEAQKLKGPDGYITGEKAFNLCHLFGTSYRAVIWKLKYNRLINFDPTENFFRKAKPAARLSENYYDIQMLNQILNSYTYFPPSNTSYLWNSFKNELVFHDSRLEGVQIELEFVAEMLTDIKLFGRSSLYYEKLNVDRNYEVIGHSFMYDYIISSEEIPDRLKILYLHEVLFKYALMEMPLGQFRKIDNEILGAVITTVPHYQIEQEIYFLIADIEKLIEQKNEMDIVSYLKNCVSIHHNLTKIHPFEDGNGRISRAIMNWLLKLKNLPPIYVAYLNKEGYFEALKKADQYDLNELDLYFMRKLLDSFVYLNDKISTLYE